MIAAVLLVARGAAPSAPQQPLAAGTYPQLAKVMIAADACGFKEFRTETDEGGVKLLFLNAEGGSYGCIDDWLKNHARELKLVPRFEGDNYTL